MIGVATHIACRHKQQLLPSTKHELPAWIYVRGKVQFKSMCCLEGIECAFRRLLLICQHRYTFNTTNSSVWTCRVFSVHHQQYGHAGCVSVHHHQYGQWLCRVSFCPITSSIANGHAGCLSTNSSMNVQVVFPPQALLGPKGRGGNMRWPLVLFIYSPVLTVRCLLFPRLGKVSLKFNVLKA
jgi:hypothetical protein